MPHTAFLAAAGPPGWAPGLFGSADPAILLLLAIGLEGYLGGAWLTGFLAAPRARLVRGARRLQARLDRAERGRRVRVVRGWIAVSALLVPPVALGLAIETVTRALPYAVLLELPLVAALVRQRGPWQAAAGVRDALAAGSRQLAEAALDRLDPAAAGGAVLDGPAEVRTVQALGARFADAAVAPALFYLAFGLPGLLFAASLRLLARLYGSDGPFGAGALAIERVLFWPARRLAALLLGLAALFQPDGGPAGTARAAGSRTPLRRALAGAPPGSVLQTAAAAAGAQAVARALWLFGVACLMHLGLVAALLVVRLNLVGG
jgi:adenosylcobinamide-phosphate synthase